MRNLLLNLAAAAALTAAPAIAQEHADHPATETAAPAKKMDMSAMTDAEMHAHCKAMMGRKMEGRVPHDHSVDKLGHVPPPATPPSEAEMKQMHETCAAMMAKETPPKTK